jgi:Flp pilus assembly protein TadD
MVSFIRFERLIRKRRVKTESARPEKDAKAPGRSAPSLLTGRLRISLAVGMALAAAMVANTLFLLANRALRSAPWGLSQYAGDQDLAISKLFQVMVLSHTGLGVATSIILVIFGGLHLPKVWVRRRRRTIVTGVLFVAAGLILAVTGPFIMYAAASREHSWVWWTHVAAAVVVPVAYIFHRAWSIARPPARSYRRFASATAIMLAVALIGHGFSEKGLQLTREARIAKEKGAYGGPGSRDRDLAAWIAESHEPPDVIESDLVPASFVPSQSPFFPSAATTTTGDYLPDRIITRGDVSTRDRLDADLDTIGFVVKERIGAHTCARCHADIAAQWAASAHRFASFNNPWYEATINNMRETAVSMNDGVARHLEAFPQWEGRTGKIKSKWCSGCHDPALMLAGQMTEEIDRRLPQAQAGLTCLACHAIDKIHNVTGNGNYNIADEQEDPYIFANSAGGTIGAILHDTAVKAKPDAHKRQMLKPFFRTSEFCATCHKVSLQEPVNSYRWLRGQDEYDNWHDSGVALNASRTFYLPSQKRVCQDCHMPPEPAILGDVSAKNGMVRSHRFTAVNTALPFIRKDHETVRRIEEFLSDEKLRIDVFALTRTDEAGEKQTISALNRNQPALLAGETVTIDVVVRNQGVGHTFPGGTNDSNEAWIELTFESEDGEALAQSGLVDQDGFVDPAAHFFRVLIVDRHGQPIHMRNAQDIYAPIYANVIGPGTANVVHYRFKAPPNFAGKKVLIRARLLWRKFDQAYNSFAFHANPEGFKQFDKPPVLPITEICADRISLEVAKAARNESETVDEAEWMRFNDYGIGLLLQGDTKGAESAFRKVCELAPQRIDGPRNLARVAIKDGNFEAARQLLLECEHINSNDPQTAWFWGEVLRKDGQYPEAIVAYRRVLQEFPGDRATWRNLGKTYYLNEQFEKAIDALSEVLAIDPEDSEAHYDTMRATRALGRSKEARRAEAAYRKYKSDESAAKVTNRYRRENLHDHNEGLPIHVHDLSNAIQKAGSYTTSETQQQAQGGSS